jgi:Holliday junction resolvasome RuvABC endonuclease subunit
MIYIGLDNSLNSPGLAIYDEKKWKLFFLAHRTKDQDFKYEDSKVEVKAINYPEYETKIQRYDFISGIIFNEILPYTKQDYKLAIEGYAYGAVGQSTLDLAELGGILRYKFYSNKIKWEELAPTAIKKHFTGKGNANKAGMFLQYEKENIIDLYKLLDFKTVNLEDIKSPVSDLVDAIGIVYTIANIKPKENDVLSNIFDKMKSAK